MLTFCGQDKCSIDANGRIKFSPRFLADFEEHGSGEVVMHCLPEGAIAVYPEEMYLRMRSNEPKPAERAASSLVFRRTMRRFGALSQSDKLSAQGRITLPAAYREHAQVNAGGEAMVVGAEIGVEIWNPEAWAREINDINTHVKEKGEREMAADLVDQTEE